MARRRHTPERINRKLAEGRDLLAGGIDLEGVCHQLGIAESTWARWLYQYGVMKTADGRHLDLARPTRVPVLGIDVGESWWIGWRRDRTRRSSVIGRWRRQQLRVHSKR
ncbi:MAG: hypothetical protein IPG97_14215 [Microthrixaceae bacterium]|nr:hypothetical protein [Microthrixaceae bacterium]